MTKLEQIKSELLVARKSGDKVKKNLLSTFVGEVELTLKGENPKSENEIVETLAKAFIKNAEKVGNDVATEEVAILKEYLPQMASLDEVKELLKDKDLTLGGRLIGLAKKEFNGNVDPKIVNQAIKELS